MASIADLKARLQNLNRRTTGDRDIWKPKDEHNVRLLPYPHGSDPFIPLYFHYELGDEKPILCPEANYGDPCDVCDLAKQLRAWKDEQGRDKSESTRKADFEVFKKIQAKARVFIPMVERGKESEGPKFWGVTPNQADAILAEALDPDRMAECGLDAKETDSAKILKVLTDPAKAYDIGVSFAKPGEKGNTKSFAQVTPKARIKASKLGDAKVVETLLGAIKKIEEVYPRVSSTEITRILKKFIGSSSDEARPEGGTEKYATNSRESVKDVGKRSVEEAFNEIAGQ